MLGMKIESLFWLSALKKDRRTSSLVIEVDDAKMAIRWLKKDWFKITPCVDVWGIILPAESSNVLIAMNTVTSRFIARKVQSAELAQALTELRNVPETKGKNARYVMVLTHRGTNDVSIRRKNISG